MFQMRLFQRKLFQCVQKSFQILGFCPSQHSRIAPFIPKNILLILLLVFCFISSTGFFLFQAKSVKEFGDSFLASITTLGALVYFSTTIWKMANLLKLIEKFEGFVQRSKPKTFDSNQFHKLCDILFFHFSSNLYLWNVPGLSQPNLKPNYSEVIHKIERLSEIIHNVAIKMTIPGVMLPSGLITLYNYLISDLKDESFFLPLPGMYVL